MMMRVMVQDRRDTGSGAPRRIPWWSVAAGVTGGLVVLFMTSARPGALVLRYLLDRAPGGTRPDRTRTPADAAAIVDEPYDTDARDARLDVYFPPDVAAGERRPAIVWVHGGAWISGTKEAAAPYFGLLAQSGFTVIAVEYSRAPDTRYPTPIRQINQALAYTLQNADRFHVDEAQIIIAGDSAGAQMASQIATLVTSSPYASEVGIVPSLRPEQLRAAILFCGAYDVAGEARHPRVVPNTALRVFSRSVLWAYTGSRERDSATVRQMSTIDHATEAFPPTFISGGNADPLTDAHSRPFAARLAELGVDVTARFYAIDHTPPLGHEYQFRVESADAQAALQAVVGFLHRLTRTRS